MELQNRNLSIRMRGEDVTLLHAELKQLGFKIAGNDVQRKYFGPGTKEAVEAFQKRKKLPITGIVDKRTAARINAEVNASRPLGVPRVYGVVVEADDTPRSGLTVQAFNKGVGTERLIGTSRTDHGGAYEIPYPQALPREWRQSGA